MSDHPLFDRFVTGDGWTRLLLLAGFGLALTVATLIAWNGMLVEDPKADHAQSAGLTGTSPTAEKAPAADPDSRGPGS